MESASGATAESVMNLTISNFTICYVMAVVILVASIITMIKSESYDSENLFGLGLLGLLIAIAFGLGTVVVQDEKRDQESLKTLPAEWLSLCTELRAAGDDYTLKRSIWDSFKRTNPPKIKLAEYRIIVRRDSIKSVIGDNIMEFVELPFSDPKDYREK
jgi:hypothetical protein